MKPRSPKTFAAAVTRIKAVLGEATCAEIVDRSESLIRKWADPDHEAQPSLAQAVALDSAFVSSGRGDPPLLQVYQHLLSRALAEAPEGPPVDILIATLAVQGSVGDLSETIAAAGRPDGPGGREITPNERTAILNLIYRLEDQLEDIEESVEEIARQGPPREGAS